LNIDILHYYIHSSANPLILTSANHHLPLPAMNFSDDLQTRWWKLEEKLINRFGKKPDTESILFLIGIQELGDIRKKFSKEQKQDLMHIAICTVLAQAVIMNFRMWMKMAGRTLSN
jgi:hypothetical protein